MNGITGYSKVNYGSFSVGQRGTQFQLASSSSVSPVPIEKEAAPSESYSGSPIQGQSEPAKPAQKLTIGQMATLEYDRLQALKKAPQEALPAKVDSKIQLESKSGTSISGVLNGPLVEMMDTPAPSPTVAPTKQTLAEIMKEASNPASSPKTTTGRLLKTLNVGKMVGETLACFTVGPLLSAVGLGEGILARTLLLASGATGALASLPIAAACGLLEAVAPRNGC